MTATNLKTIQRGLSFAPPDRRRGPLNVLKFIPTRTGVGDPVIINGDSGTDDRGRVVGVRLPISLPTDRRITNIPQTANAEINKQILRSARTQFATSRNNRKPRVVSSVLPTQLDMAQGFRINPRANHPVRGAVAGTTFNGLRKAWQSFRQSVIPKGHPLDSHVPNGTRSTGVSIAFVPNPDVSTINADDLPLSARTKAQVAKATGEDKQINPTWFFIGALVLAYLVFRHGK